MSDLNQFEEARKALLALDTHFAKFMDALDKDPEKARVLFDTAFNMSNVVHPDEPNVSFKSNLRTSYCMMRLVIADVIAEYKKEHNVPIMDDTRQRFVRDAVGVHIEDSAARSYHMDAMYEIMNACRGYQDRIINGEPEPEETRTIFDDEPNDDMERDALADVFRAAATRDGSDADIAGLNAAKARADATFDDDVNVGTIGVVEPAEYDYDPEPDSEEEERIMSGEDIEAESDTE